MEEWEECGLHQREGKRSPEMTTGLWTWGDFPGWMWRTEALGGSILVKTLLRTKRHVLDPDWEDKIEEVENMMDAHYSFSNKKKEKQLKTLGKTNKNEIISHTPNTKQIKKKWFFLMILNNQWTVRKEEPFGFDFKIHFTPLALDPWWRNWNIRTLFALAVKDISVITKWKLYLLAFKL